MTRSLPKRERTRASRWQQESLIWGAVDSQTLEGRYLCWGPGWKRQSGALILGPGAQTLPVGFRVPWEIVM